MNFLSGIGNWLRKELLPPANSNTWGAQHGISAPAPPPQVRPPQAPPQPALRVNTAPNMQSIQLPNGQMAHYTPPPPPQASQPHQNPWYSHIPLVNPLLHADRAIVKTGVNMGKGLLSAAEGIGKTDIIAPAVQTIAQVRGNPYEIQAANQYAQNSQNQAAPLIHGITRTVPEVYGTLRHPFGQFSYHPNSPLEQALFGHTPVQNIQAKVATNYDAHKNLNPLVRVGLAGAEGAGSIAQDYFVLHPSIRATSNLSIKAARATSDTAGKVAGMTDRAATEAAINHPSSQALLDHINQQKVMYDNANSQLSRDWLNKSITQNTAALRQNIEEIKQGILHGGYARIPGAPEAPIELPPPSDALIQSVAAEYPSSEHFIQDSAEGAYNMDKSLKGGQMRKVDELGGAGQYIRTSEHTPFYREYYAQHGKAPSLKAYQEAVRQEFETGRGNITSTEENQIYQLIKDREAGNQSLMQEPQATVQKVGGKPIKIVNKSQPEQLAQQPIVYNAQEIAPQVTPRDHVYANSFGGSPELQAAKRLQEEHETAMARMHQAAQEGNLPGEPVSTADILKTFPGAQKLKYNVDRTKLSGRALSTPNRDIGMENPDTYARTFNVTRLQAEKDLRDMARDKQDLKRLSPAEIREMTPAQKLTIRQRRELIANNPEQATKNEVNLNVPEGSDPKVALAKALGANDERMARFGTAERLGYKLSKHDQNLLYRYDDGDNLNSLTKEADAPEAFKKAATAAEDALDYSLALDRAAGGSTLRQQHFLPHYYAVSEDWLNKNKIPEDQRIKINGQYAGFRDDHAKYRSYLEAGRKVGLKPLYKSPIEAIQKYAESGDFPIRRQSVFTSLAHAVPDEIGDMNTVVGPHGVRFKPAAGGNLPFTASERVNNYLNAFREAWQPKTKAGKFTLKAGLGVVHASKRALFFLTPFHYANETMHFLGATAKNPSVMLKGMGQALSGQFGAYGKWLEDANKDGTMDWIRQSGTPFKDIRVKEPAGAIKTTGRKINLVSGANRKLTEFGNTLTIALSRAAKERGVVPDSEQGIRVGEEIGNLIGNINEGVAGISPNTSRVFSTSALAPYWLRTNFRLLRDTVKYTVPGKDVSVAGRAFRVGGRPTARTGIGLANPGDLARGGVVGTRVVEATAAIVGSMIATGHFPTLHQLFNEAGLNLNNPVPNVEGNSKNSKGEKQVIEFPTDPAGLATMAVTDPQHFASSRYSPFLASAADIAYNRNWQGQPLVDPNTPNAWPKRIAGGAKNLLPISLQNATSPTLSIKQGLVQDIGGRYKTDPNDPQAQANKNYFNALKQEGDNLKNSGQYGQYWAQQFANLHPSNTTDASGNKYPTPYNPVSSEQKYAAYTAVDAHGHQVLSPVFYADQKLANMTPNYPSSPLYKLQGNGIDVSGAHAPKALVAMQYQHAQLPQQKAVIMAANGGQNGWLGQYENQVADYSKNYQQHLTSYFKSLGWTDQAVNQYWQKHPSTPDPIDQVNFDANTTNLINHYYQLTASGNSTAASQFFSQHADVLGAAFDQTAQHANALRAAKGELQLQGYPPESQHVKMVLNSMPQGSDKASKKARALLINGNPDVSQYLANVSLYEATSKGTQLLFKNPANMGESQGQLANSTPAGQSFLKAAYALGNYDIGLNPTTGLYSFMQGGTQPPGANLGSSGGGYRRKPYVYHHKLPKIYAFHPRHQHKVHLKQPKSLQRIKLAQKQDHIKFIPV